ncbi:MAG: PorT family protein [Bacteroidetes bacterium]|nr:PorT family protein [Bacteroidota bacterium]
MKIKKQSAKGTRIFKMKKMIIRNSGRKIIILMVIIIMFSSILNAQGLIEKGLKTGMNLSKFTGETADMDDFDVKSKLGFIFGGFITYNVNKMLSLQPEIYYTMQGAKYICTLDTTPDGATIFKYNYIQIPLLAKFNLSLESNLRPNIIIGPAIAFNISAHYEYTSELGELMSVNGYAKTGEIEGVNPIDFGLVFGLETNIGNAIVDIRYNLGLVSVDDYDDFKNSTISIMVGYLF